MYRTFLNFAKSCILSRFSKFCNKKKFHSVVCEIKALKADIEGVLAGHSVAMVTYCATEIIPAWLSVIGQFFDIMIVASIDNER